MSERDDELGPRSNWGGWCGERRVKSGLAGQDPYQMEMRPVAVRRRHHPKLANHQAAVMASSLAYHS